MRSLAAVTFLSTFANAYKTFPAICTKPTDVVNYVSSTNTRSTLDIIWSCLLTIVACTRSVQHLNVPEEREGRDPGWMRLAREDGVPWSSNHTLFADMGGSVIRSYVPEQLKTPMPPGTDASTLKSKFGNPFHINASELYRLPEAGMLERLPFVSEEELLDKSKGDNFVRLITIAQILWMVVLITACGIRHVAISQLEVGITAFAACAILI
ncbi:uncharacterized protein PAC_16581 [Phialocephala subalpina]|uniref:Uncharacterized protein n=1 Tax=Phialocephala subalpina TaxID=576137 RepID=A0A1L7XNP2_9HELO|nr:uncharacterized protein PAC_16581 [Phialocephala subalpina]